MQGLVVTQMGFGINKGINYFVETVVATREKEI